MPYKGAAQATTDLVGGQVQMMFGPLVAIMPLADAGKLRALAVTSAKRSALAPERADHDRKRHRRLRGHRLVWTRGAGRHAEGRHRQAQRETNKALKSAELIEQFRLQGYEPLGGTPDEMNAQIKADTVRWTRIIQDAGIQPQ